MAKDKDEQEVIRQATQATATSLQKLVNETYDSQTIPSPVTSHLSVPERDELIELISQILPAGNVVSFVFASIINIKGRNVPPTEAKTHINSIFKGLSLIRNNKFYEMMFLGPATVLAAYQMLLKLTGRNPTDYLPDGAWQFYVEFGLREDTARHNCETIGFHQAIKRIRPAISETEKLAACVLSSMWLLKDYLNLLENLWEEHEKLRVIEEKTGLTDLYRQWQRVSPFSVPADEYLINFSTYRRQQFEAFCQQQLTQVSAEQRLNFERAWNSPSAENERRKAVQSYQKQLSMQAYLDPKDYSENRIPIGSSDLYVGVIYKEKYHLLKMLDPANPTAPIIILSQCESILNDPAGAIGFDLLLAQAPRAFQAELRKSLSKDQQQTLQMLRKAPIIINWDETRVDQPLSYIRSGQRGVGDHALTIFRTNESLVFDFSHIYFDGPWAMAVAEIFTNEAARQLHVRKAAQSAALTLQPVITLDLTPTPKIVQSAQKYPYTPAYISAEASIPLASLTELRRLLTDRTRSTVNLTINDILVLYRSVFNQRYRMGTELEKQLNNLRKQKEGKALIAAVDDMLKVMVETTPSMLIPIDATRYKPRERVFPSTFRSPFPDFLSQHDTVLRLLQEMKRKHFGKKEALAEFHKARGEYLSVVDTFGRVMRRYRSIAIEGQSVSIAAIRMIAGLPDSMKRIVDDIPGRFSFVNEAIKGEEVFSNVGRVVPGSSISRFGSAKDDNDKKVLVWGIMTNDQNQLYITLRDFRPPVLNIARAGHDGVAQFITQDFLEGYMTGLEVFVQEIKEIISVPKV
jgi:hypothetical protein